MTGESAEPRFRPLHTHPGSGWLFLSLRDEGVMLGEDHIAWYQGYTRVEKALADIRQVNLRVMVRRRWSEAGMMLIGFADGTTLGVHGCASDGRTEAFRAQAYRELVVDLHRRLAGDAGRIAFVTGYAGTLGLAVRLGFWLGVLLIGGMVLWLLPHLGQMDPITVFMIVVAMPLSLVPLWRMVAANRAGTYDPAGIPADLLP